MTIKCSFLSNHHFSHIIVLANSSSPNCFGQNVFSHITQNPEVWLPHSFWKGTQDKREWRGKGERQEERSWDNCCFKAVWTYWQLKSWGCEGVRDDGGTSTEKSPLSLSSPLSLHLPFCTASQIKWPPLCPPIPHQLGTFTPHFYVKVHNTLPHLVVLVLSVTTLLAASCLESN